MRVGAFPGPILASDAFPVVKLGAARGAGADDDWSWGEEGVAASSSGGILQAFSLSGAQPNPFSSQARFTLDVAEAHPVMVAVYDGLGRRVATLHEGALAAGTQALTLDASSLPAGVYVIRAAAGGEVRQQVATVVR